MTKLAELLDVPPEAVVDALDRLAELALLRPSWEAPEKLRPTTPQAALRLLIQQRQAELLRQQQQIDQMQALINDLFGLDDSPGLGSHPDAERLVGMDAVQSRIEELALAARHEVASCMPGGAQTAHRLETAKKLDRNVLKRGVAIRTLGLDSIRADRSTLAYAKWLADQGAEFRTLPTLPIRMLIYDRKIALLPLDPNDTRAGAVQVSDSGTITAVLALFEQLWAKGVPINSPPPAEEADDLSRQEREMLRLLANGLTDEAVGRHLGLSQRTVRRMMASVMERLGARSRFEAGRRAAERGWV